MVQKSNRRPWLRWVAAYVAVVLLVGTHVMAADVAGAGNCFLSSGTSDKVYVDKDSVELANSKFDYVRGDGTVGNMNPCVGTQANQYSAGSWMLLANLQRTGGTPVLIVQAGYGQACTQCIFDFVYTPGGDGAGAAWPRTLMPQSGHRVRAIIERVFSNPHLSTRFTIRDIDTGVSQTASISGFPTTYDKAWWGTEALDTSSEVGQDTAIDSNFAYLGYSTFASGSIRYRSGMVFNSCYCEDDPGAGPSEVEKEGGTNSAEHGHLGDWVYGDDMVNFESH